MSVPGPNPYVGPRSYERGEFLYGRDREILELLDLLIAERIVLLYSPSGAGKSSLIRAGLTPKLAEEMFEVLPVTRVSLEPPRGLALPPEANRYVLSLLLSLEEALPAEKQTPLESLAGMTLSDYLDRRQSGVAEPKAVVLLMDQFEEILTVDPTDTVAKTAFFAQVGAALRDRRRWALLAMREEFVAALDPYLRAVPTRLSSTYRLELLGEAAARLAVQGPARQAGADFTDAAARKLVDDLRRIQIQREAGALEEQLGPWVEPVQLQVVCHRLWQGLKPEQRQIHPDDLEAVGDVNTALADYYGERVEAIARDTRVSERAIRDWCERELITEQGIRGQVLQEPERSRDLDNRVIGRLLDAHLMRAEKRRGATWFELAHDRLIAPMRSSNAHWYEAHLSALQRQVELWDTNQRDPGFLISGQALVEAEQWARDNSDQLTPAETTFLDDCRKVLAQARREQQRSRLIAGLAVAAVVAALASVWFLLQAKDAEKKANAQRLADKASALAKTRLDQALLLALAAMREGLTTKEAEQALFTVLTANRHLPVFLQGHTDTVTSVAFSLDGKLVATGSEDGTIILRERRYYQPIGLLREHQGTVNCLAFGRQNNTTLLASAGSDTTNGNHSVILWKVNAGHQDTGVQEWCRLAKHRAPVRSLAFLPCTNGPSAMLASASEDREIILWKLPGNDVPELSQRIPLPNNHPSSDPFIRVAFRPPDGSWLGAASSTDLWLWPTSGLLTNPAVPALKPALAPGSRVFGIAFSPNGSNLVSVGPAHAVVWDTATASNRYEANTHQAFFNAAFSQDGTLLALSGSGPTLLLQTDPATNGFRPLRNLTGYEDVVLSAAFSPDNKMLLLEGSRDGTVILWDSDSIGPCRHGGAGTDADFFPTNAALAFGPYSRKVACARAGGIDLYNWEHDLRGLTNATNTLVISNLVVPKVFAVSADGQMLAWHDETNIILWNSSSNTQLGHYPVQDVSSMAFTPDSRVLAVAQTDGIWLFDLPRLDRTNGPFRYESSWDIPLSLAFSPNGQWLAAGNLSGTVSAWKWKTDPLPKRLLGQHDNAVISLAFSSNGLVLASASCDNTVLLWGRRGMADRPDFTYEPLGWPLTPANGSNALRNVAFTPSGPPHLLAAIVGQKVVRWEVGLEAWKYEASRIAGRDLTSSEMMDFLVQPGLISPRSALHQASMSALEGNTSEAGEFYRQAVEGALKEHDPDLNDSICWYGSLDGFAGFALRCGVRAVELVNPRPEYEQADYRDTLGLARALTGDYAGAIEDFKYFEKHMRPMASDPTNWIQQRIDRRRDWISALQKGENPFSSNLLMQLKVE